MRQIDANDLQRLIVKCKAEELDPKTIRNIWGAVSLMWQAALAGKFVDALLPKPKLPRKFKTKARFFKLEDVARILAASKDEQRTAYWLLAETGIRAGELAGLRISDIAGDRLSVSQSVWHGEEQQPKTQNAIRTLALSPQLVALLWGQIARQKAKGQDLLFSASTGSPLDMDAFRHRKMRTLLESLGIPQAGFHAFRHFNMALLDSVRTPLKVIQDRMGHALTGSFTLDVYGHVLDWQGNVDAALRAGAKIEEAVAKAEKPQDFVNVSAVENLAVSATC
jgi:integrase